MIYVPDVPVVPLPLEAACPDRPPFVARSPRRREFCVFIRLLFYLALVVKSSEETGADIFPLLSTGMRTR